MGRLGAGETRFQFGTSKRWAIKTVIHRRIQAAVLQTLSPKHFQSKWTNILKEPTAHRRPGLYHIPTKDDQGTSDSTMFLKTNISFVPQLAFSAGKLVSCISQGVSRETHPTKFRSLGVRDCRTCARSIKTTGGPFTCKVWR